MRSDRDFHGSGMTAPPATAQLETTVPSVVHECGKDSRGTYVAHVEAVNALTRSGVASATVVIRRN